MNLIACEVESEKFRKNYLIFMIWIFHGALLCECCFALFDDDVVVVIFVKICTNMNSKACHFDEFLNDMTVYLKY